MQEIELKFLVPEYKVGALLRQVNIKSAKTSQLAAHYFDNIDKDLAQSGAALRIRKEGDNWVQTLKSGGDGLASRLEDNTILDAEATADALAHNTLVPDVSVYADTKIPKQIKAIKKLIAGQDSAGDKAGTAAGDENAVSALKCQYITDVTRITRLVKKEDATIEVAYDEGLVIHGEDVNQSQAIHEIEFELLQGTPDALFDIAKLWCKRYQLCISTVTKAERGGLLLANRQHAIATKADLSQLTVRAEMSQPQFMRAVVHNCMLQILPNASAIAAGSEDGNHVHQLRVGVRRLRTALKFFAGFSADINPEWTPVLKQTFSLLGEYRDREILQIKTQPMLEALGGPHVDWSPERDTLSVMPVDAVRANDFQMTLLDLIHYTMSSPEQDSAMNAKPAKQAIAKIMTKLYNKISGASGHFAELDIEAQHDVRKRLKSLRYISEFIAPMYKKSATKTFLTYLEPAQDVLGEYNDALVGHDFYQDKTKVNPNAWFAVGYFGAEEKHAARHCAQSLTTIKDAPIFW